MKKTSVKDICIVCPRAYPVFEPTVQGTFGGAEVQLVLLATTIKNLFPETKVRFLVADYGQSKRTVTKDGIECINIIDLDFNVKSIFKFIFGLIKYTSQVNVHRAIHPATTFIALISKLKFQKFVYMVAHDTETDATHPLLKSRLSKKWINLAFKISDLVITQNNYQLNRLTHLNNKVCLIPNGINLEYKLNFEKKYDLLWVGRSDSWKQPLLFLELAKSFPQFNCMMICTQGVEKNSSAFHREIKVFAGSLNNCEFSSFVPFMETNSIYAKSKLLINTSESEGFSNAFLQAATQGVPIVSLNADPNQMLSKHNTGKYCNNSYEQLQQEVHLLLTNLALLEEYSTNAFNFVKKHHDINMIAEKFINKIDSCVA